MMKIVDSLHFTMSSSRVPQQRNVYYLSLAEELSYFLADPQLREAMRYRIDESRRAPQGQYWDVFDGAKYKSKLHLFDGKHQVNVPLRFHFTYCFKGPGDIALPLYADEFNLTRRGRPWKMTLVHVIIFNLPPELRYETRNTFQLRLTPGAQSVDHLWSFLEPILDD